MPKHPATPPLAPRRCRHSQHRLPALRELRALLDAGGYAAATKGCKASILEDLHAAVAGHEAADGAACTAALAELARAAERALPQQRRQQV